MLPIARCAGLVAALILVAAAPVRAQQPAAPQQGMWTGGLFAAGGVELRTDERVFALFSAFNMLGYDRDHVQREKPVPLVIMHPHRVQVRGALQAQRRTWEPQFQPFFDSHAEPIETYLKLALGMKGAPKFDAAAAEPAALREFAPMLANFYGRALLGQIYQRLSNEARGQLKQFMPLIDERVSKIEGLLRVDEDDEGGDKRIVFVFNLLDAHDSLYDLSIGDIRYVVAGPVIPGEGTPVDALVGPYAENLSVPWLKAIADDAPGAAHGNAVFDAVPADARMGATDWRGYIQKLLLGETTRRVRKALGAPEEGKAPAADSPEARMAAAFDAFVQEGKTPMRLYLPTLLATLAGADAAGEAAAP